LLEAPPIHELPIALLIPRVAAAANKEAEILRVFFPLGYFLAFLPPTMHCLQRQKVE
jgi:hypothetical protein